MPVGVYKIVGTLDPLPGIVAGVSDTYTTQALVYLKKPRPSPPPYDVASEFICADLARLLRLPVPPGFVARVGAELCFCSLSHNLSGDKLPPIDAEVAVQGAPDLCAGVTVFDVWIVNTDRHRMNISYQASREPHRLNVIDHSHALFQDPDSPLWAADKLGVEGSGHGGRGNRQCLLDWLMDDQALLRWIARIGTIDETIIRETFLDARDMGLPDDLARAGTSFLLERRGKLREIISANRGEFPKITNWGLEWPTP